MQVQLLDNTKKKPSCVGFFNKKACRLFPFPISSYNQGKVLILTGKYICQC